MIEKLGSKRLSLPVVAVVLVGAILALLFYPLLHMTPKDLPFAVLSTDQGAQSPDGEVNMGEAMVGMLSGASESADADAPIQWNVVTSEAELDQALEENVYFGALVIPEDFTQAQLAAQINGEEAPAVTVILDKAKSPVVATQMQPAVTAMFEQQGVSVNVEVLNAGNPAPSTSPLSGMMALQLSVMPLMIMSLVSAVLLTRIIPQGTAETSARRLTAIGKQLAYAIGLSALASLIVVWLLNVVVSSGAAFWPIFLFLWFASLTVMTLFLGGFNVASWFGVLLAAPVILLGTMTATLPPEMLPTFWTDWVYPWAPQRLVSAGVRDILYRGAEFMPWGTGGLLIVGATGLVLLGIAGVVKWWRPAKASETMVDQAV